MYIISLTTYIHGMLLKYTYHEIEDIYVICRMHKSYLF